MGKSQPLDRLAIARSSFKDNFPGFAIADFDRIDDPGTLVRRYYEAIHQSEHGFRKINVQQRFRRGKLENLPVLKQPVEAALAQIEKPRLNCIRWQRRLR